MKLSAIFAATTALISAVIAAPVNNENESPVSVPEEALLGFIDLTGEDVSLLPVNNGTHSGILFLNSTIAEAAYSEDKLSKREAEANANPWKWITLRPGQPIFKREADASAEADADAWKWITLRPGQPIFKREAAAEAEANPWKWITLRPGQPIF